MIIEVLIYCLKIKSPCSMNTFIIQFQINEFQNQTLCNDKTENILKFDEMLIYDINYKKYTHKIVCQWFSPYQAYQDWTKYLRALIMYFQWVVFFLLYNACVYIFMTVRFLCNGLVQFQVYARMYYTMVEMKQTLKKKLNAVPLCLS